MRPAPAVSVQGTGGPLWALVLGLLPGLAGAAALGWLGGLLTLPGWLAPAAGAALAAWVTLRCAPPMARLVWDGQAWTLDGQAGDLVVMIDLDRWLLLRWQPAGGGRPWQARWPALAAAEAPGYWHLLRAALFAARTAPASVAPRPARGAPE